MGDTDEDSDSDNSRLNQTIAPTRTKAIKDRRRAQNFSEELTKARNMAEQSSSNIPRVTAVKTTASNTQSTSAGVGDRVPRYTQDIAESESGFIPPVASTVVETEQSPTTLTMISTQLKRMELADLTTAGAIVEMTQLLREIRDGLNL